MNSDTNVIIFGGYVNGYSIARTIYETYGIKSHIFDYVKRFSSKSRIVSYHMTHSPAKETTKFLDDIKDFGKATNGKENIIFVTNDEWLIPLAKYKSDLEEHFTYTFSDWEVIEKLTIKKNLYKLCETLGIPYPNTKVIDEDSVDMIDDLQCPLLVKPSSVVNYMMITKERRNNVFNNHTEAKNFLRRSFKNYKDFFIVQEYIPGGPENLYTATTYSNKNGFLKGISIGHKLSQNPPEAGTITAGYIEYIYDIEQLTKKLLRETKYYGIANTEYKYDKRDNTYKMIEVNPRPGMWNYSSLKSGVNLFYLLIEDLHSQNSVNIVEDDDIIRGKRNVVWTVLPRTQLKRILKKVNLTRYEEIVDPRKNSEESIYYQTYIMLADVKEIGKTALKKVIKLSRT